MLRITASLADGIPADLRDTLTGLDQPTSICWSPPYATPAAIGQALARPDQPAAPTARTI